MLSALYAIARPSVHLSVCLSVGRVYHRKTVEVRIMNFSPYGSPTPLVLTGQVSSRNSNGTPERERQTTDGEENNPLSGFKRQYLENSSCCY